MIWAPVHAENPNVQPVWLSFDLRFFKLAVPSGGLHRDCRPAAAVTGTVVSGVLSVAPAASTPLSSPRL